MNRLSTSSDAISSLSEGTVGSYGLFINPTDPTKYDMVMEIVGPHLLQQKVHTRDNPRWYFGDWPAREIRDMLARRLVQTGIDHSTLWLTGSAGKSPERVVLSWHVGATAIGNERLDTSPKKVWFTWRIEDDESLQNAEYGPEELTQEIKRLEVEGKFVPESFHEALELLSADSFGLGEE